MLGLNVVCVKIDIFKGFRTLYHVRCLARIHVPVVIVKGAAPMVQEAETKGLSPLFCLEHTS